MKTKLFITILIVTIQVPKCSQEVFAQSKSFDVNITCKECPSLKKRVKKTVFSDSSQIIAFFEKAIVNYKKEGFLTASVDSMSWNLNSVEVKIFRGTRFEKLVIKNSSFISPILDKKYTKKISAGLDIQEYDKVFNRIVMYFENHGYPFAKINFDSIEAKGREMKAVIVIDESTRVPFRHLKYEDKTIVKPAFLENYLEMKFGSWFSRKNFEDIENKISRLSYMSLQDRPQLRFVKDSAVVSLQLTKRKASFFDGFVGFFPNQTGANGEETLVTGKVDLKLVNPFKTGKQVTLFWNRQKELSQTLKLNYYHPLLFGSRLNTDLGFSLFKEDTAFITRSTSISLVGRATNNLDFKLSFLRKTGDLLSGEKRNISAQNKLLNTDYEIVSYGLGLSYTKLDDYLNPRRGNVISLFGEIGKRTLGDNANITDPGFNLSNMEESRLVVKASSRWYLPLINNLSIYHALETKHLFTPTSFLNDMFRLGGLLNLRGFNDNFFFASNYALSNLEARLHFEELSYLFLLYDQSWIFYKIDEFDQLNDQPLAIGAGLNLDTGGGILKFVYALGNSESNPFDLRQSKIHVGFEAKF